MFYIINYIKKAINYYKYYINIILSSNYSKKAWIRNIIFSTSIISIIPLFYINDIISLDSTDINIEIKDFYSMILQNLTDISIIYNKAIHNSYNLDNIIYNINNINLEHLDIKAFICNYTILEFILNNYICNIEIDPSLIDPAILNDSESNSDSANLGSSGSNVPSNSGSSSNSNNANPNSNSSNGSSSNNSNNPGSNDSNRDNNNNNNETQNSTNKKERLSHEEKRIRCERLSEEVIQKTEIWEEKAKIRKAYYEKWLERVKDLREKNIDLTTCINERRECFQGQDHLKIQSDQEEAKNSVIQSFEERKKYTKRTYDWINHFTISRIYEGTEETLKKEFTNLSDTIIQKNKNK